MPRKLIRPNVPSGTAPGVRIAKFDASHLHYHILVRERGKARSVHGDGVIAGLEIADFEPALTIRRG